MATCAVESRGEENVVQQLNELFGNVLNIDIIKTVAVSCHYDVTESSNKLLEISSLSDRSSVIKTGRKPMAGINGNKSKHPQVPSNNSLNAPTQKKSKKMLDFERTVKHIEKGYKVLVIVRGVPGCGKSYLAKRILESTIGLDNNYYLHILSADDFFFQSGVYRYDSSKISEAHGWNHNRAFQALSRGFSPVIIDNTNTQMWEMKPYAMMATDYGYIIEILEPDTHWCSNDKELAKRNTHGVPKSKIRDMLDRYEKNITSQKLLSAYNLNYRLQKPPQIRLYPPFLTNNSVSDYCLYNNEIVNSCNTNASNIMKSRSVAALNPQSAEFKVHSKETINLMDFNDDGYTNVKSQSVTKINNNEISVNYSEQNLLDKILMCSNDIQENVLQPSQGTILETITIDSSDDENQKPANKLFLDLETAWGINENALRSWDIVTPLKDEGGTKLPHQSTVVHKERKETSDFSCNTEEEYFQLLRSKQLKTDSKDYILLETVNRDINHSTPTRTSAVLKVPMLDKSCLTEDIFEDYDNHMSQLVSLFPTVSQDHLKYWYTKCKGDLEWTIEFILENQGEVTVLIEESDDMVTQMDEVTYDTDSDGSNSKQKEVSCNKEKKIKWNHKESVENIDLKKEIESKIDINEEHYSKHLLRIKQYRFGNLNDNLTSSPSKSVDESKASTSRHNCVIDESVVIIDSDTEFDEFDVDECSDKSEQPEEMVELNLGDNFVSQLETKFGDPNTTYPKGFQPVVQVPVTLARQLYTFYIESICQQMENQKQILESLIKEDEEFARKLQAKEEEKVIEVKPAPNFKEIIDEQVAQNVYQREVDKWKELNPDNLAARLTRQKLCNVFPTIDKDTLIEILYAHENKYQDTVETLLASTGTENIRGNIDMIKEPPLRDEIIQEMKEAQKSSASETYDEEHEPTYYREEANRYLKKRAELYQKAQQYHQRGMTEVAQFYSGLASKQTLYYDRANNMAATAFLDEHSKRLQDFNTIDLHFLYVKEAIPALDVFLDRNINLLKLSNNRHSDYLQIITGRGKRSENGISKIRPAVISRLKRRNIKFVQLNPGLLKVKITKTCLVTSELQNV
ncbi:NEDD4-binding protein 2-like isoform X2 [Anoplophora glabripennis]|nr:NEDD4-binding protein 2-like isoform X2 [Anoplophora glabripennis]